MALPSPTPDTLVPFRRVLPVMGRHVRMAALRLVRGRLRIFVRTGLRVYVPREDYLSLCEAAWDVMTGTPPPRRDLPKMERPADDPRKALAKPIHDGRPLDRYRRSPVVRMYRALGRWWRNR